jgi:hypothetical protein
MRQLRSGKIKAGAKELIDTGPSSFISIKPNAPFLFVVLLRPSETIDL